MAKTALHRDSGKGRPALLEKQPNGVTEDRLRTSEEILRKFEELNRLSYAKLAALQRRGPRKIRKLQPY
jgi:hypothetical protein